MNWYLEVLQKYAIFDGRARRTEYWMFALFNAIIYIVLLVVEGLVGGPGILGGIYNLVVFIPSIAVTIRRLHDTDRSGWWLLIGFVPCIGIIVMLFSIATGIGLQKKIKEKISGFNGDIQISNFDTNNSKETVKPINLHQNFYPTFANISNVKRVHPYATKAGIIRTADELKITGQSLNGRKLILNPVKNETMAKTMRTTTELR